MEQKTQINAKMHNEMCPKNFLHYPKNDHLII